MPTFWLICFVCAAVGVGAALAIHHNRTRRILDDRLAMWLSFLSRPTKPSSKPFNKATTARLSVIEYDQIRRDCYTPGLHAEWDERETKLINEFAIRAIRLQQVFRRQQAHLPMTGEELELLVREGVREAEAPRSSNALPSGLEIVEANPPIHETGFQSRYEIVEQRADQDVRYD